MRLRYGVLGAGRVLGTNGHGFINTCYVSLCCQLCFVYDQVPPCTECGGDMMPQIVFFGDNVNRQLVEFLYEKVEESDAVLALGSSLQVSRNIVVRIKKYMCIVILTVSCVVLVLV